MTTSIKLYTFGYTDAKTYLWAALFIVCNMILPQLAHLVPRGGIIFAPLSFVILAGAYKFGWKTGLLAALASPVVNHFAFGMPTWGVVPVMAVKLALIALVAGLAAQHFRKVTLPLLAGVVLLSLVLGGLAEFLLTGSVAATLADVTIGIPGLLLQVFGVRLLLRHI